MEIGTIYTQNNWQNLNDFTISNNWSLDSGKLKTTGSNGILQYKHASALEQFKWKIRTNSATLVIKLAGAKSANNINTIFSLVNGKAQFTLTYDGTNSVSNNSIIIENGDILEYIIERNIGLATFTVKNITKNTSTAVNVTTAFVISYIQFYSNTACEIQLLEKSSMMQFSPMNLVVGDSITRGSDANPLTNRWVTKVGFLALSSPGDTSTEALLLLHEIFNIIKPKRIIFAFGTNDLNIDLWKSNMQLFRSKISQKNIVFIPITPYANSTRDMTSYKNYVSTTFDKYFDVFSVTKVSLGPNMKSEYNSGDGVHYNNIGHAAIADHILTSQFYTFDPIVPNNVNSGIISNILKKWFH